MPGSSVAFEIASAPYGLQPQPPLDRLDVPEVERDRLQVALKRALDVVSSLALLLLLSPLMLSVMVLIRATSPGPALFRQRRVGLKGKSFEIYKFRSMVESAESLREFLETHNERPDGPTFKMRYDPRVTTVGRFIRRFSIDELPQFLNVLRGDMSLVGPRPPIPSEVRRYESWQLKRLSVPPGLTCSWQVTPNRCALDFTEWVQLDLAYIDGWHLGRDLLLIARTVPAVLTGRDQY
jgi:lipopolysaccharide/colanic/teichoic acid biosynthesis glycosyltransferase